MKNNKKGKKHGAGSFKTSRKLKGSNTRNPSPPRQQRGSSPTRKVAEPLGKTLRGLTREGAETDVNKCRMKPRDMCVAGGAEPYVAGRRNSRAKPPKVEKIKHYRKGKPLGAHTIT